MLESLLEKVAGLTLILKIICQRILLHCAHTIHCYLYVLLYIQHLLPHHHCYYCSYLQCLFLVQIQMASKSLNLVSHFHWSPFISVIFFSMFFLSFSVLFHFFLSLLIKRILLSWELLKMFLPPLTSLKYVCVSK